MTPDQSTQQSHMSAVTDEASRSVRRRLPNLSLIITVPISVGLMSFGSLDDRSAFYWLAAAPVATWALAHLIAWLQARVDSQDIGEFGVPLRGLIVLATPLWLFSAVLASQGDDRYPVLGILQTALGYVSMGVGLAWVILGSWGAWRHARRTRDALMEIVEQDEYLNELLASAERARFLEYRRTIFMKVVAPLKRIEHSWESASNDEIAHRLEVITQKVMRPLAHQLHPVTLRVGLIQAVRSLGTGFRVTAEDEVIELDQRGRLLKESLSPQVFRWIRNLVSEGQVILIHFAMDGGDLVVTARQAHTARALDPIQQVAGLVAEEPEPGMFQLRVVRQGAGPITGVKKPRSDRTASPDMRSLFVAWTRPPAIDISLILYIGIVSSAVFSLVRRESGGVDFPIVTLLSVVMPALIAWPLTKVPIREGTRRGAVTVIALWLGLAVAAGLVVNAVLLLLAPAYSLFVANTLRFVGSIIRYGLVAPAFIFTRGLVEQAVSDQQVLRQRESELMEARAGLLSRADDTDRFLAEALHRNVQGKITAIALLLRLDRRDEAVQEFHTLTRSTLVALEDRLGEWMIKDPQAPGGSTDTGHELRITGFTDWSSLEREDMRLAERMKHAVQEISVNALRHGQATTMDVHLSRQGNYLTFMCTDDGNGPPHQVTPGLGSALLDELCWDYDGSWSLVREADRTCVRISVHLGEQDSSVTMV